MMRMIGGAERGRSCGESFSRRRTVGFPHVSSPRGYSGFLAQGDADTTIPPQVTARYMQLLCRSGSSVRMIVKPGIVHRLIAHDVATDAVNWISDRFKGLTAPSDCRSD